MIHKLTEAELDYLEEMEESSEEQEEEDEDEEELDRGDTFDAEDEDEDEEDEDFDDSDEDEDDADEEDEEDPEDEDDDEEDEDDEDDEEEQEPPARIPRGRLNEVLKQRDEERQRAKWLETQLENVLKGTSTKQVDETPPAPPAYDFDTAEDQYIELLLEGSKKEAIALRKEIETQRTLLVKAEIEKIKAETETVVTSKTSEARAERAYEEAITKAVATYPFFDHNSDAYNSKAVDMANALLAGYTASGMSKAEALAKAVKEVAPFYKGDKKKVTSERTRDARKLAADASKKQPKDASRRGTSKSVRDLKTVNVGKLSERDFNSLSEKERRILRGD